MGERNHSSSQGDTFSLSVGGAGGVVKEREKKKGGGHKRQRSWAGNKLLDAQEGGGVHVGKAVGVCSTESGLCKTSCYVYDRTPFMGCCIVLATTWGRIAM